MSHWHNKFRWIAGIVLAASWATPQARAQGPEAFGLINQLEGEVQTLLDGKKTDEAAEAILDALPSLALGLMNLQGMSLLDYPAERLRKQIDRDEKLLPRLKEAIESLGSAGKHDEPEVAAMFEIVGANDEAGAIYARILETDPDPPPAVRHRQIRLIGAKDPAGIKRLLRGLGDGTTRNSLGRIFYDAESFEASIAVIDTLAEFLEEAGREEAPPSHSWVPRMEITFSSIVYGEIQMPPIWEPDAPHDPGYKGRAAGREAIELRQRAYERYCRAAAKLPKHAAWGFSRVAAMADLRGEFVESEDLVKQARGAIKTAKAPTPYGLFAATKRSPIRNWGSGSLGAPPRFFSPELYLAYRTWKDAGNEDPEREEEPVARRLKLLSCESEAFIDLADELIRDSKLNEVIRMHGRVISEREHEVASRRLGEVLQIWFARGRDVELFDWILDLELEFKDQLSARVQSENVRLLAGYLEALHRDFGAIRVHDALEQLAYVYLGRPEERTAEIAKLPSRYTHSDWSMAPARVQYVNLLKTMTGSPALAFPAFEKAIELGIDERVRLYKWLQSEHFATDSEYVIERLRVSPLVEELKRFRAFPAETSEAIRNIARNETTLLDWVVNEIGKLKPEQQTPYREFLANRKTFGAEIILASLKSAGGDPLRKALEARLPELREVPARHLKGIALFAIPRLPESAAELMAFLESQLEDANPGRLKRLEAAFLENTWRSVPSEVEAIFPTIFQSDPEFAFQALHRLAELYPNHLAKHEDERNRFKSRNHSFLSELLSHTFRAGKKDEHAVFQFYLRVINDEKLSKGLIIEDRPFHFEPADSNTIEDYHRHFVDEVAWVTNALPDHLPEAYLFPAVMGRYGWMKTSAIRAAQTEEFHQRVIEASPPEHRDIVRIANTLGSRSYDWVYGDLPEPGWKDPEVAAAFAEAGKIVADESLSLPFRVFLAALISVECRRHTPPELSLQFAGLLADAWEADAVVGSRQEERILKNFLYSEQDAGWKKTARRLISAWRIRIEKIEEAGPEAGKWVDSETIGWLIGISAAAGDRTAQSDFIERLNDIRNARFPLPTTLLVRAGETEAAAKLFSRGHDSFVTQNPYIRYTKYDAVLAENIADYLGRIPEPGDRFLAEIHLKVLDDSSFDTFPASREQRLMEMAGRFGEIEFERASARFASMRLLAKESAASAIIAEELVVAANLDDLAAIHDSNQVYAWRRRAQEMIIALVKAGKFDRTLEVLRQIGEATKIENTRFSSTWDDLSDSVSSGVSAHQRDPEKLEKMLPLTRFMAALPPEFFKGDRYERMRAGNYARNIFCHALLDRMDEWQAWRESLDPELRENLDAMWYPQSGWAIGLTTNRTPDDATLEHRLGLMKRILSLPEIVGKSGALYTGAIRRMANAETFSTEEFLEHGPAMAEVIPDGGQAWSDLADIAEKAAQPEKAAEFRKRADKKN